MVTPISRVRDEQSGIGLIEIVVSILLLGLLAVSALPLLVNAMQLIPRTASLATANELVASEVGRVQGFDTCNTITPQGGTLLATVGTVEYAVVTTVVDACPSTFPSTMRVTVSAGPNGGDTLTTTDVLVFVKAAL